MPELKTNLSNRVRALPSEIERGDSTAQAEHAPRIAVVGELLPRVYEAIVRFREQYGPHLETGGMLVGEFHRENGAPCFLISDFIDAGPLAECSSESVLFDHDYQAEQLARLQQRNPRLGNMGCLHLHPGEMDECSTGDQLADIQAVRDSDTRVLIFAIVTLNNPRRDSLSIRYRNLKLDLFVMEERSGCEYLHVQPVLVRGPETNQAPRQRVVRDETNAALRLSRHHNKLPGLLGDKRRLVAEVRAMEEKFGERATLRYERSILFWEYTVQESGRRFPVEVRYPRRYPLEPPRIISRLPLPPSPHQLVGHELCWIDRSAQSDWNPARDTAATCITAAHRWFACLLVYLTLGEWPEEANDAPARPC